MTNEAPAVQDVCTLHPDIVKMTRSDQVEHLSRIEKSTEAEARAFFDRTHVTVGMDRFLRSALKRLAGTSDQAIFELKQAMGGGKTHNQIALGLLARFPHLSSELPSDVTENVQPAFARVAAINGRDVDHDRYLWGDIATRLGSGEKFARFWKDGAKAPREGDWLDLIGDQPTVIMLDELPPYLAQAHTQVVGKGTLLDTTKFALTNLLSAAMKAPRCVVVIAALDAAYEDVSTEMSMMLRDLRTEASRGAQTITPVDLNTDEIYDIIRKRLFSALPGADVVAQVSEAYRAAIDEAVRGKTLPAGTRAVADDLVGSYPFHPSYKHTLALFKDNASFRQTRGLIEFTANLLRGVWERGEPVPLIGAEMIDLSDVATRDQLRGINRSLDKAMASDVYGSSGDAHAQRIDAGRKDDLASRVARMMFVSSLSDAVESARGLPRGHFVESIMSPTVPPAEVGKAFDALKDACWYMHSKDGERFHFSDTANLRKQIEDRANRTDQAHIDDLVRRRIEAIFTPRAKLVYQDLQVMPNLNDIRLQAGKRVCFVLSPENKNPPESAERFLAEQVMKNAFCVISGDQSAYGGVNNAARRLIAVSGLRDQIEDLTRHKTELDREGAAAEKDFATSLLNTINVVWYPFAGRSGVAELKRAPIDFGPFTEAGQIDGEGAIVAALSATGAGKVMRRTEENAENVRDRMENGLFPDNATRSKWADMIERAYANPRFVWLHMKDMEAARDDAVARGVWSFEDGEVNKNPPPPMPAIAYDAHTASDGETTFTIAVSEVGDPEIFASDEGPDVFGSGQRVALNDGKAEFSTKRARAWFGVRDAADASRVSPVRAWSGKVAITYDATLAGDVRRVTLACQPPGKIRWTADGTNPREGRIYDGEPINVPAGEQVTLQVLADADGVEEQRQIRFEAAGVERRIDDAAPAVLRSELRGITGGEVLRIMAAAKRVGKVTFSGVIVKVGEGHSAARLNVGSDVALPPEKVERIMDALREIVGNDGAASIEVETSTFENGFALREFGEAAGIEFSAEDVEQDV